MARKLTDTANKKKIVSNDNKDVNNGIMIGSKLPINSTKGKGTTKGKAKPKFGVFGSKQESTKKKLKRTTSSSDDSDSGSDSESVGGSGSGSDSEGAVLSDDDSNITNVTDSGDDDTESDILSDSSDNITNEDLSDLSENTDESNISDSDISNPKNLAKGDESCVHDYIGSEDEALEELESDKVKIHDLTAVDYFKDYNTETVTNKYLLGEDRITKPYLFDYERIKLLSVRTKQLSSGAKSLIKDSIEMPAKLVAELEIQHNVIPLLIERPLPNGKSELWKISELTSLD